MSEHASPWSSRWERGIDIGLWALAWVSLGWIVIASLGPAPGILSSFDLADKVVHALHFALTTLLFLLAAAWRPGRPRGPFPYAAPAIAGAAVALGALLELLQGLTGWRTGDVMDLAADAVGVAVGVAAWAGLRRVAERTAAPGPTPPEGPHATAGTADRRHTAG